MEIVDYRPAAVVDFSLPGGTCIAAEWCEGQGVPLVSGTTGLGNADRNALDLAATRVPVLHAANFSVGVNIALELVSRAAELLGGADAEAIRITEVHHAHKQDAPSGTALALAERLGDLDHEVTSRREGEVVGEHEVRFELPGESLTVAHSARDRAVFAHGALRAARWLAEQPAGRYTAIDWLSG
jgi:4-hydroxy-tetrahydrodipicolinate reductase